jgi:Tfp pilus assembly protein PilF
MKLSNLKKFFPFFFLVLIFSLTSVIYSPSLNGDFVFDDYLTIVENDHVLKYSTFHNFIREKRERIIPFLTFNLQHKYYGIEPYPYHLFNLGLHISNAVLVFILMIILTKFFKHAKKYPYLPYITTLIFAVHPVQTQAVSYITQRFTLFAAFFSLLSIVCYLLTLKNIDIESVIFRKTVRIGFLVFALSFSFFAYLSKENAFILPLMIILFNLFFPLTKTKNRFVPIFLYFLVALTAFYLLFFFDKNTDLNTFSKITAMNRNTSISRSVYFLSQSKAVIRYFSLSMLPVNQNIDYDYSDYLKRDSKTIASCLFIALLLIFAFRYKKRFPLFTFGIVFFFTGLLIESSFFPIDDIIFEHRLYLPSLGVFIIFSNVFCALISRKLWKKTALVLLFLYISILSYLTFQRNYIWQNEINLWTDSVKKSPYKARPYSNLGAAYLQRGDVENALENFHKAIKIDPEFVDAYQNIAAIYERQKDYVKAIQYYESAANFPSRKQITLKLFLAKLYVIQKQPDKAKQLYLDIIDTDPRNAQALNSLGVLAQNEGKKDEAIIYFHESIARSLRYENAYLNLADLYNKQQEHTKACHLYKIVLGINPDNLTAQNMAKSDRCLNLDL